MSDHDPGAHESEYPEAGGSNKRKSHRKKVDLQKRASGLNRNLPSKRILSLTLAPLIILTIAANVGQRTAPTLITSHPLLLLALQPSTLIMAAVSPQLATVTFFATVIVRQLLADPFYFMIGRWYGDRGIGWAKRKMPDVGQVAEFLEKHFPQYGWLLIMAYPHALVILLAGASTMSLARFMFFDLIGVVIRAVAIREFGWLAGSQIESATGFIGRNQLWFNLLSVALLLLWVWSYRAQIKSPRKGIEDMEEDIERGGEPSDTSSDGSSSSGTNSEEEPRREH